MLAEELKPIEQLLVALESSNRKYDLEKIKKAFLYADDMHKGQMRQSGEPYITHPISVAEIVVSLGLDTDSVCAAFLHDTVEDCIVLHFCTIQLKTVPKRQILMRSPVYLEVMLHFS